MLNLALVSKTNLRCCDSTVRSTPLLPAPFLSLLFSRSISLTPFSLSGSTSACRSGYLIHVQRHSFLIPLSYCAREANQTCPYFGARLHPHRAPRSTRLLRTCDMEERCRRSPADSLITLLTKTPAEEHWRPGYRPAGEE